MTEIDVNAREESFEAVAQKWLESKNGKVKKNTYQQYQTKLKQVLKRVSGKSIVEVYSKDTLLELEETFIVDGFKPKTIENYFVLIKTIIGYYNSTKEIKTIGMATDTYSIKVIPNSDVKRILAVAKHDDGDYRKLGSVITLYTGLNVSEICALKWEDIDLPNKTLYVRRAVARVPDTSSFTRRTKLEVSDTPNERMIPINHQLGKILALYTKNVSKSSYILSNSTDIVEPRSLQYYLKNQMFIEPNGFKEYYKMSDLKDTFIVVSLQKGVSVVTLSNVLGITIETLHKKYQNFIKQSMELEMEKLIY